MIRKTHVFAAALASALLYFTAGLHVAEAQQEYVSKVKAKTLHKAPLPGVSGKEVIIKRFEFPPKFTGGRHRHPGPVYVYVLEGEFTIETAGKTKTFTAGQLYREPLNQVMQARNLSKADDLKVIVFQVGDIGKPMMIKEK